MIETREAIENLDSILDLEVSTCVKACLCVFTCIRPDKSNPCYFWPWMFRALMVLSLVRAICQSPLGFPPTSDFQSANTHLPDGMSSPCSFVPLFPYSLVLLFSLVSLFPCSLVPCSHGPRPSKVPIYTCQMACNFIVQIPICTLTSFHMKHFSITKTKYPGTQRWLLPSRRWKEVAMFRWIMRISTMMTMSTMIATMTTTTTMTICFQVLDGCKARGKMGLIYCGDNERAKACLKQVMLIDKGVFPADDRDYGHIFVSGMVRSVSWSRHWMGCCCC